MATTATCTRFTDEYQLYEELGKYGARCAPRHPPSPGAASRLEEDDEEEDEPPSSDPAPRAPRLQEKVSPQSAPGCALLLQPGTSSLPPRPPQERLPLLLPAPPLPCRRTVPFPSAGTRRLGCRSAML